MNFADLYACKCPVLIAMLTLAPRNAFVFANQWMFCILHSTPSAFRFSWRHRLCSSFPHVPSSPAVPVIVSTLITQLRSSSTMTSSVTGSSSIVVMSGWCYIR